MAAQIYTFQITYQGLEDKIWRKVGVSSNYRLDQLGYLVLAAFDTLAYHLFEFRWEGKLYGIPDVDDRSNQLDMARFRLDQLGLKPGARLQMDYDFGTTQTFWLELLEIQEMPRGQGRHYPYIFEGAGRGIIDDMDADSLKQLVEQIDRNGQTDQPILYQTSVEPWDYRYFDLKCENALLKCDIEGIEAQYMELWVKYAEDLKRISQLKKVLKSK